jgi:hypothetical protein
MRIKNKEIRARRHRKEQKVKDAQRIVRAQYAGREPAPRPVKQATKPAAKKPAAKKKTADSPN